MTFGMGVGVAAAVGLVVVAVLFRSRTSRLIAVVTLVPLLALGATLHLIGQNERVEADDIETHATVFGDQSHEMGATHGGSATAAPTSPRVGGPTKLDEWLAPLHALDGFTWPDRGKPYTRATLWNRIDGGAELYREHGMKRALFATARLGDGDIEVQLFELGSPEQADALWARATQKAPGTTLRWEGGGEVRKGALYARIVLSSASDAPQVLAAPARLIEALGGTQETAEPTAAPKAPSVGLPDGIPGVQAQKRPNWGGRTYLGEALVGEDDDENELFVTAPADPDAALEKLKASLQNVTETPDGTFAGSDPYLGDVVFSLSGGRIAGVAGFADRAAALKLLKTLLAEP